MGKPKKGKEKSSIDKKQWDEFFSVLDSVPPPETNKEVSIDTSISLGEDDTAEEEEGSSGTKNGPINGKGAAVNEDVSSGNSKDSVKSIGADLGAAGSEDKAKETKTQGNKNDAKSKTPWLDLFSNNRSSSSGLKLEKWNGDISGGCLELEEDDIVKVEDSWGFGLVGYVAGKNPGKGAIVTCCNTWGVKYKLYFHESSWIIFKFDSLQDRDKVLEKGPYLVYGKPLLLKVLTDTFTFGKEDISKVPIWVKFPNLPVGLWHAKALGKIASCIGKPIQSDKLTQTMQALSFARVLVEVDVSKKPIFELPIKLPNKEVYTQKVVYEYWPNYCSECKVLGHAELNCKALIEKNKVGKKDPPRQVGKSDQPPPVKPIGPSTAPNGPPAARAAPSNTDPGKQIAIQGEAPNETVGVETSKEHVVEGTDPGMIGRNDAEASTSAQGSANGLLVNDNVGKDRSNMGTAYTEDGFIPVRNRNKQGRGRGRNPRPTR